MWSVPATHWAGARSPHPVSPSSSTSWFPAAAACAPPSTDGSPTKASTARLSPADYTTALRLIASGNLIGIAPTTLVTALTPLGLTTFQPPMESKPLRISLLWHPRHENDPPHRWLRTHIHTLATR